MVYNAIIVDDEPHARRYLKDLVATDNEINLIGEFGNGREALQFLSANKVDVVLLDIEMPNTNGLEVAYRLAEELSGSSIIIFTTAYNQYAITAFEAQALDYLLKPFDQSRFEKAIDRAKKQIDLQEHRQLHSKIASLYEDFKRSKAPQVLEFKIKEKGLEICIKAHDIIVIEASGVYAVLIGKQKQHLYRVALNDLESKLPSGFLRIHRSFLINLNYLEKFRYLNNSTFKFHMTNGKRYSSGRSYRDNIKLALNEKGL